jgi:hypothetical protein
LTTEITKNAKKAKKAPFAPDLPFLCDHPPPHAFFVVEGVLHLEFLVAETGFRCEQVQAVAGIGVVK